MARPTANLRLFVGIYPPLDLADAMRRHVASIDLPPNRLTPAVQVHLTVHFIGDTPAKAMDETVESVQRSASGIAPFELEPKQLIRLPKRGPARLIALETDAPAGLLEIQSRLAIRFASKTRRKPGDRFLPHITLCRFRTPTARGLPDLGDLTLPDWPTCAVRELCLMRSTLTSSGAVHHVVERVPLSDT